MSKEANPDPQGGDGTEDPQDPKAGVEGGDPAPAGEKPGKLELTQAELDDIVKARTAQARRVAAEAADKAKQWDEHQAAQQTEAEKAEAKQKAREEATASRELKANQKLILAEALIEVRAAGIDPEFEDMALASVVRADGVEIDDEGEVAGVKDAVKALVKAKPKLVAKAVASGTPSKSGGEGFSGGEAKTPAQTMTELDKKVASGDRAAVRESIGLKMQRLFSTGE